MMHHPARRGTALAPSAPARPAGGRGYAAAVAKSKAARRRDRQRAEARRRASRPGSEAPDEVVDADGSEDADDPGSATHRAGDLSGFAEFRRSAGPLPTLAAVLVAVLFSLGVLAWVFLR